MRTESEKEVLDNYQTEFQKKQFQKFVCSKQYGSNTDFGYTDIKIYETGWYVISVLNDTTLFLLSSKNPAMPYTPLYSRTNNLVWFDKDEMIYIAGNPNDYFNIGFYGAHKPDIHDKPCTIIIPSEIIPRFLGYSIRPVWEMPVRPIPERFMGYSERPVYEEIPIPIIERFMGYSERPVFEEIPIPVIERFMGYSERPVFEEIPIPGIERFMGYSIRPMYQAMPIPERLMGYSERPNYHDIS